MAAKFECVENLVADQAGGGDLLRELLRSAAQAVMAEEVTRYLGADAYERSEERRGRRNGTKPRSLKTRVGELSLRVPQVRGMEPYHPSLFALYQRSERALLVACAEMYYLGVSTRKVGEVLEKMGGFSLSAATVSQVASELDEKLTAFRSRPLHETAWPYLQVDACYVKARESGRILSRAALVVSGIHATGGREILTWRMGDSESEEHWGGVFLELKRRGLKGLEILTSDGHEGIQAALRKHLPEASWQRCRVHFMRNALTKVGAKERSEAGRDLKSIFASPDKALCLQVAEEIAVKWEARKPKFARQIRDQVESCLTVHHLPSNAKRRLHSTNMLERVMREIKRRTNVVGIFPNTAACDRLIGAHLLERHETWQCEEKRYIVLEGDIF
jgi:putative transposase